MGEGVLRRLCVRNRGRLKNGTVKREKLMVGGIAGKEMEARNVCMRRREGREGCSGKRFRCDEWRLSEELKR